MELSPFYGDLLKNHYNQWTSLPAGIEILSDKAFDFVMGP